MADEKKLIDILSDESYNYLLSKTAKVLPNNPTEQGWSAERIKKCYYEGFIVLFEWLKKMQSEINSVYNKSGVYHVEFADKDGEGNNIVDTYATKERVKETKEALEAGLLSLETSLNEGSTIVAKAKCDAKGNNIADTYLEKSRVAESKEDADTTKLITLAMAKGLVSDLVNGAPEALDTLGELAKALQEDQAYASTLAELIGEKLSEENAEVIYLSKTDAQNTYAKNDSVVSLSTNLTNLTNQYTTEYKEVKNDIDNLTNALNTYASSDDIINMFN